MSAHGKTLAAVALALVVGLPAAAEELTIVSKTSGPGGAARTATAYLATDKFRHSDGEHDSIMDFATGRIVTIDHKKKSYWETTLDEMRAMTEKANEQMKQMQEQMKQNPQAAAMMQKMMGAGGPAEVKVEKGPTPRKIAGYECDQYVVSIGDAIKMDMWVTTAVQPPAQIFDARKAMTMPSGPMAQGFGKLYEEMKKIKGYPLAEAMTFKMMGMANTTSTEATEVKKGAIPASAFAIPAGYKKEESPFKKMAK